MSAFWTQERAETQLRSLELFGMRFGLDRMRRMMTALGSPERAFATVHVLGTNGKSSTTRMTAEILRRHGLRTGAYTSPHLVDYRERILLDGVEIGAEDFSRAVAEATRAAERVNRTLHEDDHVTQFELLTAAGLWAMAQAGVEVAVIEAGLGGRYDATSVIDAPVMVLTNVGLEHTRWLGPTIADIAEEKLAVVPREGTLVLGDLHLDARGVAERVAGERSARIVEPGATDLQLAARGPFQRDNFGLAWAAAAAHLARLGRELDPRAVRDAAAETTVPGRMQLVGHEPPTLLDGAHNPHAARALVEALGEVLESHPPRPLGLVLGVLEDKDANGMLRVLLPRCERAWFTAPPSSRALSPAALESGARQLGFERSSSEPRPIRALEAARRWANEVGGAVLATGSVYLVGDLLRELDPSATLGARKRAGGSSR
jgi:dihydrofolate synthase / folylpolyglutamate synthase